jgi:putative transposase
VALTERTALNRGADAPRAGVKLIEIDQTQLHRHGDGGVREAVEQTLNELLDAAADALWGAKRYERSPDRTDYRAGSYARRLHPKAGEVELKVPKLRRATFESQVIQRYQRRETSGEEALVERYLAGVSVRRVEDITEALWGPRVSPSTVSELNQKLYARIPAWRNRPLEGAHPYVYLDGVWRNREFGGEVRPVAVLVARGVNSDGFREILGVREGAQEDAESWRTFLRHLKERGLRGVPLAVSDKGLGLIEALGESLPQARGQRCVVHFYRNVFRMVPTGKVREVAALLKAIHAQEDREAALAKAAPVVAKLEVMRLSKAAELVRGGSGDAGVHELPAGAWDTDSDQQSAGAAEPGDQASDAGGGDLPGWGIGPEVGGGVAAVRGGDDVGTAAVSEQGSAEGG